MYFSPITKTITKIPSTSTYEVFDKRGYIEYIGSLSTSHYANGYGTEYYKSGYKQDRRPYKKGIYSEGHLSGPNCSEFSYDSALIYSGSYLQGLRHGEGISYNQNGSVEFSGQWIEGTPQGTITITSTNFIKNSEVNFFFFVMKIKIDNCEIWRKFL